MPRVYLFTILISVGLGMLADRIYLGALERGALTLTPTQLGIIVAAMGILYWNEKRAMLENLLRAKTRRAIGSVTALVGVLLTLVAFG